ncbi:MAG: PrgI family protein [Actinomycetaceae bacterium]|nr:PrgI family protein [Actinomycetaceae bacterium]
MALEVKVYRDLEEYKARAWFGMTGRQFVALCGIVLVAGGTYVLLFFLGYQQIGQFVAMALAVPFGAWGWVRRMGLNIEDYGRYMRDFHTRPKTYTWVSPCPSCVVEAGTGLVPASTHDAASCTWRRPRIYKGFLDVSAKKVRKNVSVFETEN